jgi:hypothetical protein
LVCFLFFLSYYGRKAHLELGFGEVFLLVSPAFQVRSTVCCRFLHDTRPSTGLPVFFRSSRRQPRPCGSSLLGAWLARVRVVSALGRACGPRSAFPAVFGAVRCSLVVGRAGITPGMARGLHALSLRRRNSSPTVALLF